MNIDIESDNKDVNDMVLAAKGSRWEEVCNILDRKSYLINCIPENRAWSALHQAVFWNNSTIVTKLLGYEACDAIIKSKQCRDEMIAPSSTATDLAKLKGYDNIRQLLTKNIENHRSRRFGDVPRFVTKKCGQQIAEMGFPLFALEVVMYKTTLLNPDANIKNHSVELMKQIFDDEKDTWPKIEVKLYQALYGHCKASAEEIRGAHAKDEATFFKKLIEFYTGNLVYKQVNKALGREFQDGYKPAADDLALGLYALLLDITITFWAELEKFEDETFRGVDVDVTNKYKPGQEIMFTTMVSCTRSQSIAEYFRRNSGTLFKFDNSKDSSNRPRNIETHSSHNEQECLYTLGTSFKVHKVNEDTKTVELILL